LQNPSSHKGVETSKTRKEVPVDDLLYRIIAAGLQVMIWGGEVVNEEDLPERGPAVFVSNHLGALGPIAVAACVPRRLYPWIAAEMLDRRKAPDYLRLDFVEKRFGLKMPVSLWAAKLLSLITVRLLNAAGCIPVYKDPEDFHITAERSLDLLVQGRSLLIFPEDPDQLPDPGVSMNPFMKGFTRLGELYFQRSGRALAFIPLAVHEESRLVKIGTPIRYNPFAHIVSERLRIKHVLERMIHEIYLELGGNAVAGVRLPH
jgi:hypothetical protein